MRVLVTGASGILCNAVLRTLWEKIVLPRVLAKENALVLFCPEGLIASKNVLSNRKTLTMFRSMVPFDSAALGRIPLRRGQAPVRGFIGFCGVAIGFGRPLQNAVGW